MYGDGNVATTMRDHSRARSEMPCQQPCDAIANFNLLKSTTDLLHRDTHDTTAAKLVLRNKFGDGGDDSDTADRNGDRVINGRVGECNDLHCQPIRDALSTLETGDSELGDLRKNGGLADRGVNTMLSSVSTENPMETRGPTDLWEV